MTEGGTRALTAEFSATCALSSLSPAHRVPEADLRKRSRTACVFFVRVLGVGDGTIPIDSGNFFSNTFNHERRQGSVFMTIAKVM